MTSSHVTLWSAIPFPQSHLHQSVFLCEICREHIPLEDAKTDEHGLPVHEHCYVARLTLEMAA